ncbi:hypothetical protein ACEPPN_019340 [Leptodophora sp. 'Broadleaf-Isolate-01']
MEYKSLNSDLNQIRLLALLPGDETSMVHCSVQHVSLVNPPSYTALSYCWGDPLITTDIVINEKLAPVTTNLESALRSLRRKGYTCLWVDAICINQKDKTEKSQQLLWMGSIYQRASEIVAWTGDEGRETKDAVELFENSHQYYYEYSALDRYWLGNLEREKQLQLESKLKILLPAMISFLERPYWKRVWVIQELALSMNTRVHSGAYDVAWSKISSTVRLYDSLFGIIKTPQGQEDRTLLRTRPPAIGYVENLIKFHEDATVFKPLYFLEALQRSIGSLSTDPRDKVFALLSLVYDGRLYVPVPNYSQTVLDICLSITLSAIATTSHLEFIPLLAPGCHNNFDFPSWLPNWMGLDESFVHRQVPLLLRYIKESKSRLDIKSLFKLDSSPWMQSTVIGNGRILRGKAIISDEVRNISLTISEATDGLTRTSTSEYNSSNNPYKTKQGLREEVSSTLIWDLPTYWTKPNGHNIVLEFLSDFWWAQEKGQGRVSTWLRATGPLSIHGESMSDIMGNAKLRSEFYHEEAMEKESWPQIIKDIGNGLDNGMRFMVTMRGYVGWIHREAEKGDKICIFQDCEVPFVLRPRVDGGYSLVGDAWIKSLMSHVRQVGIVSWSEIEIY